MSIIRKFILRWGIFQLEWWCSFRLTYTSVAVSTEEVNDLLKKYDKGANSRELKGFPAKMLSAILICFTLFQLYTAIFGVMDAMLQRAIHLAFGLSILNRWGFIDNNTFNIKCSWYSLNSRGIYNSKIQG